MAAGKLQALFGDDWEDTRDAFLSAPGALGNIAVGAARQVRVFDVIAAVLAVAGSVWLVAGFGIGADHRMPLALLALLPIAVWLGAGVVGGFIFMIGSLGRRSLKFWETYLLIGFFTFFGTVSLRIAVSPKDRHVVRPS